MKLRLFILYLSIIFTIANTYAGDSKSNFMHSNTETSGYTYYLPMSELILTIQQTVITHKPGYYANFAKENLGIDVQKQIKNDTLEPLITLEELILCDTSANVYFDYTPAKDDKVTTLSLLKEYSDANYIILKNTLKPSNQKSTQLKKIKEDDILILPIESTYEKYDTLFKSILKDSIYVKMPFITKSTTSKTDAMKAKEMANYIKELEHTKALLIESIADQQQMPHTIEESINKSEELIQKYLKIFVGTIDSTIVTTIIHLSADDLSRNGIIRINENKTLQVIISSTGNDLNNNLVKPLVNCLIIRQPKPITIEIKENNETITQLHPSILIKGNYRIVKHE